MKLDYVKLRDNVQDLQFTTNHSACFDSWCGENHHDEYKKIITEKYKSYCTDIRFWKSFGKDEGWNKSAFSN